MLFHQDDIIFTTFLYPFLERRTIKNATYTLTKIISNYIAECCEITKYCLDHSEVYTDKNGIIPESQLFDTDSMQYMYYRLNSCIHSFIVRSAILNEEDEDWISYVINKSWRSNLFLFPSEGKIFCLANDKKETQLLLARDKKFMNSLRKVEHEFRNGFTTLADLRGISKHES